MPITPWLLYADHSVAPICRSLTAIVRFDPNAEKFQSFPSDRPGAQVRQILGRPGEMWGAESGTDRLVVVITH